MIMKENSIIPKKYIYIQCKTNRMNLISSKEIYKIKIYIYIYIKLNFFFYLLKQYRKFYLVVCQHKIALFIKFTSIYYRTDQKVIIKINKLIIIIILFFFLTY